MAPTPEQTRVGYHKLWDQAQVKPEKARAAMAIAAKALASKSRYVAIEVKIGVPWFMVAALHTRESSMNFSRHLHNGDPLTARTRQVPAGRPKTGSPPFTFEDSATDALCMPPHSLNKVTNWSVERILYESEKYNGWGYLGKGPSPYIWSWTAIYHGGKYIADHVYSPTAVDPQPGCAAIMKALAEADPTVAARLANRQATPPPDVDLNAEARQATEKDTRVVAGGTVAAGGAGAVKATTEKPAEPGATQFAHSYVLPLAIAIGIVVVAVFAVRVARKTSYIKSVW